MKEEEKLQVKKIRNGDEKAFENLFFEYYNPLCKYSMKIVKSESLACDAVQEVFLKIWRNRKGWDVYHSLKVYLYQAVRNQSLDLLEEINKQYDLSKKLSEDALNELNREKKSAQENNNENSDRLMDLIKSIWGIAEEMPERRRTVFTLHRRNGFSYKEIGNIMGITRKTVENHMALALKTIRENIDHNDLNNYKRGL